MSILQQRELETAADLIEILAPLGSRPLSQIITVSAQAAADDEYYFNQIEHFVWDTEKKELDIQL